MDNFVQVRHGDQDARGLGGTGRGPEPWRGGGGAGRGQKLEQTKTWDIEVKQHSPLLAAPSPAHRECPECDELLRLGLPLHLARGGGVLCHLQFSEGIFPGMGWDINGHDPNGGTSWKV